MKISTYKNEQELGLSAAKSGIEAISAAAEAQDRVTIIIATGTSQFTMLEQLVQHTELPWDRIDVFHLDEYVGISADHPASFRKYLNERFVARIKNLGSFHEVFGDATDLDAEVARLNALISARDVDVCFAGIGENGHLAFNDPPANFQTTDPYIVVELDQACRQQQCNEGWFDHWHDVPSRAISMSVQQILKSKKMIVSVPGEKKATAVRNTLDGDVSPLFPSSILQQHNDCHLFIDNESARLLARNQPTNTSELALDLPS